LVDEPNTGGIRVCGTCAGVAPSVTTSSHPERCATSSTRAQKARQRTYGSTPDRSTRSRASSPRSVTYTTFSGQTTVRVTPSSSVTCGRSCWKSKKASLSMRASGLASWWATSQSTAAVDADAASK
jgi:hypothetical protein